MFTNKQIQKILKINADGIIGPKTIAKAKQYLQGQQISRPINNNNLLIMVAQKFLISKGYSIGDIDGLWGKKSHKAFLDYQGKNTTTRNITRIFVHCSATPQGRQITPERVQEMHTLPRSRGGRGWSKIGYHYIITLDGVIHNTLDQSISGIQVRGFNANSIGVCYIGGMTSDMKKAKDTRTQAQKQAMAVLIKRLHQKYPSAWIGGHRDISPDKDGDGVIQKHQFIKQCPCFDVKSQLDSWLK